MVSAVRAAVWAVAPPRGRVDAQGPAVRRAGPEAAWRVRPAARAAAVPRAPAARPAPGARWAPVARPAPGEREPGGQPAGPERAARRDAEGQGERPEPAERP